MVRMIAKRKEQITLMVAGIGEPAVPRSFCEVRAIAQHRFLYEVIYPETLTQSDHNSVMMSNRDMIP